MGDGKDEGVATVSEKLQETARYMIWELEGNRLDVSLGDAPEKRFPGHKIRVVNDKNPGWYRDLCADYPSARNRGRVKFDTIIRRASVLRALREIASGVARTRYAQRLLPYVVEQSKRDPKSYWQELFR